MLVNPLITTPPQLQMLSQGFTFRGRQTPAFSASLENCSAQHSCRRLLRQSDRFFNPNDGLGCQFAKLLTRGDPDDMRSPSQNFRQKYLAQSGQGLLRRIGLLAPAVDLPQSKTLNLINRKP